MTQASSTTPDNLIEEPDFLIDPEFRDLLPPTSSGPTEILEAEIVANGGPDHDLVVWKEQNILIDGHRRYAICKRNGIRPLITKKSFPDREAVKDWMWTNQLQRRNLCDHDQAVLTARYLAKLRGDAEAAGKSPHGVVKKAAEATGQSIRTVHRQDEYQKKLGELHPDWQEAHRTKSVRLPITMVSPLARLDMDQQAELLDKCLEVGDVSPLRERFKEGKPTPKKRIGREGQNGTPIYALTPDEMDAKLTATPALPPDVPSAMPGQNSQSVPTHPKTPNEIVAMINECERLSGPFTRSIDSLFSAQGLGDESRSTGWKRRIDTALRTVAIVLQEVRDRQ